MIHFISTLSIKIFFFVVRYVFENALLYDEQNTTKNKKQYEHQNNEGDKKISNTNKLNPYILPSIHRLPILSYTKCDVCKKNNGGGKRKT